MNKKIIFGILGIIAIGLTIYLFNKNTNNVEANELTELRVGYLPIAVGLPLFVAEEEGYFKEQGFSTSMNRFATSNAVANAATANQIDVFIAATNVILDVGFVSSKKHKLIYTNPYSKKENHIADYLIVKDTNSIKSIPELKGKRIGIFPGSVARVFTELILKKYNLNKGDYTLVPLAPKDWIPAMKSGQIDALSAVEPLASMIIKDGIGFNINSGFLAELMPDVPLSAQWISEDFIKENGKESAEKVIKAMNKSIEFIQNNPEKAKLYLKKYANLRDDIAPIMELNPWKNHSEMNLKDLETFVDILSKNKAIQNKEVVSDYLIQ